ncbi:hypothetical protein WMO13_06695 [Ignatzschineria larvae DSM 13226]|uniref:Uncharacterized protein n=1 Tax=Ignatzschineria larvae DSM 13226 TaxID=1111732 RepID=A0ABZ3BXL8_9GAMM|nr:hypothetical protein [Ignatzschineria larvae]
MREMNDWLDSQQAQNFSALLKTESDFIELAVTAEMLLKAIKSNNQMNIEVCTERLESKLKLLDQITKRRNERFN